MTKIQKESEWLWKDIDWEKAQPTDIKKIIKMGGDVNDVGWHGRVLWRDVLYKENTPLSLAVQAKNVPVVKYLLEHKADPNFILADRYYDYGTRRVSDAHLFSRALKSKNKEIIDLFFQQGVDPYNFDPAQEPKKVLQGFGDGFYANGQPSSEYDVKQAYTRYPLYVAIETDNLDALKKMTSAPYTVPKSCIEEIRVSKEPRWGEKDLSETVQYWDAFVDQMERNKRKGLRQKLAEAHKKGDHAEKLKTLIQLRPVSRKDIANVASNGIGELLLSTLKQELELKKKGKKPLRDQEAEEYKELKRKYNSKTAREAHKAVQAKRAKTLEK